MSNLKILTQIFRPQNLLSPTPKAVPRYGSVYVRSELSRVHRMSKTINIFRTFEIFFAAAKVRFPFLNSILSRRSLTYRVPDSIAERATDVFCLKSLSASKPP